MKQHYWIGLVVLTSLLFLSTGRASAQYGYTTPSSGFNRRPPISPYLNLYRRGGSPGFNYYSLVRPQLETQRSLYQLGQQQQGGYGQQQLGSSFEIPSELPSTGHGFGFQTQRRYFQSLGSGGGLNRSAGYSSGSTQPIQTTSSGRQSSSSKK